MCLVFLMQFLPTLFKHENHRFQLISKNIIKNYVLTALEKNGKLLFIGIVE